jgi:hypothetical protein
MTVSPGAPDGTQSPSVRQREDASLEPVGRLRPVPPSSAREAAAATCPYLTGVDGAWRQASPTRDHRCGGLEPPAPQPAEKQRRHCLSPDHVDCSIFQAVRSARAALLVPGGDPAMVAAIDAARRPIARTAPILLERPRLVEQAVRLPFDRGPGQLALVVLMIVAFGVVAIARLSAGSPQAPAASVGPSNIPQVTFSPTPVPTATPSPSPRPSTSAAAPSVEPSFRTTYTVKKGDTLTAIARRFGTTATAIRRLNQLTTSTLHAGQVLKIP